MDELGFSQQGLQDREQSAEMPNDIDIWLSQMAKVTLTQIGVERGQIVIDFGCGPGYTAIPAGMIAGETGCVYAVEKSGLAISQISRLIKTFGIENITPINTHGNFDLPFDNGTIDFILAFDVLLPYYFSDVALVCVVKEMYRVSKPTGALAVYPSHISIKNIRPIITEAGFKPNKHLTLPILHDGAILRGEIFTFTADGNR